MRGEREQGAGSIAHFVSLIVAGENSWATAKCIEHRARRIESLSRVSFKNSPEGASYISQYVEARLQALG